MLSGCELWCRRLPATQLGLLSVPEASLPKMQQLFPPLPRPEHTRGLPAGGNPGEEPSSRDQWVLPPLHWTCKTEGSGLRGGWGGFTVLQLPLPLWGRQWGQIFACSLVPFPEDQWRLPVPGLGGDAQAPLVPTQVFGLSRH